MNLLSRLCLGLFTLWGAGSLAPVHSQPSPPVQGSERIWESVELPANFVLDLMSGLVASRPEGERPVLSYSRGRLMSVSPLRLLPMDQESPRPTIQRDGGDAVPGVSPVVGQELVFDCFDEAWGYLRVLEVTPEAVTLEYLLEPNLQLREVSRLPSFLQADSGPAGVRLGWENKEGQVYRVERRRVARGPNDLRSDWSVVAELAAGEWVDDEISLENLTEYRVSLVGGEGGFGATALGVAGIERPEIRAEVGSGTEINLLSLIDDGLRNDVKIEYVRPNGVQIFPGGGIEARQLSQDEEESWILPEVLSEGYPKQRFFVPPGRVLALRLPEGAYCLLRVERVREDDSMVVISRQIDLNKGRIFPPVPELPQATWEADKGVVFEFGEPRKLPPSGIPVLTVEREETLDAGDWKPCTTGEPGQRTLVDSSVGEKLLVRYRFRQGLEGQQVSLSSEPLTVLLGGESDEARTAMLERAVLDLGSEDYDRRGRARAVLLALGEGAWPILRDSLRSNNVELASAARELLLTGLRDSEGEAQVMAGGLARLFLSIRAEELGSEMPPHPDWISPEPGARASAALRGLGWRQAHASKIAIWRRILMESDPDDAVRQVASLAALLGAEGLGPDLSIRQGISGTGDEWLIDLDLVEPEVPRRREPWAELVQMQAHRELAEAQLLSSEELSLAQERRVLARYLTAHFERIQDDLFLDCALRLIENPVARLQGALDLAESQRRSSWSQGDEEAFQVVRLEAPSTELLLEELNMLRLTSAQLVDLVLPAGIYESLPDGRQAVVEGSRFRIRGEGGVELHLGFTLMKGCDAQFENLSIVPETGIGVNVVGSRLVLRDCLVRGGNLGLLGTDAVVELERSSITAPASAGRNAAGMRFGGRSMLLASESRIESTGVAIYGARAALLDRCVVVSAFRNAVEGGSGGDLWIVNSLVQADKAPFSRISQGVLDGAVLVGDASTALSAANGFMVCAEHLRCDLELDELDRAIWLDHCTLGR
jgi:hypothetical protein